MLPGFGFDGLSTDDVAQPVIDDLESRGLLRRRRARSSTATRPAGAAARRSSSASSTTGSSRPTRSASRCSTRTRPSSGRPTSTRSAWTTGFATWATGTSRGSATSACRCRSIRARCGHLNVIGSRAELEERAVRRARPAPGAAPPVDRRGRHPLRGVRRGGAARSRRSATPGSTPGSSRSRRSAGRAPSTSPAGNGTGAAKGLTLPTCPITRTGRSGSRRTGSRRCASRSGSGSTRSRSCR